MKLNEQVANAILLDLLDRSGIQNILEEIKDSDPETYQDIKDSIAQAAMNVIADWLENSTSCCYGKNCSLCNTRKVAAKQLRDGE